MKWIGLTAAVLATVAKISAQAPPANVPVYNGYAFTGCFEDNPANRTLNISGGSSSAMTVEGCIDFCSDHGLQFAGLETGVSCFCGEGLLVGAPQSLACNETCTGNPTQLCGGVNTLSVYSEVFTPINQPPPGYKNWKFDGCFADHFSNRTFNSGGGNPSSMTIPRCIDLCDSRGFKFAGLEYVAAEHTDCYCGDAVLAESSVGCNKTCSGDAFHLCGGTLALSVYQAVPIANVPSYKDWTFTGCFGDNPVNRSLHHGTPVGSSGGFGQNVLGCLDTCESLGFGFAGLEFGTECYCGNALLYGYGSSNACTNVCTGNATQLCGGPNALSVYGNGKVPLTQGPASIKRPDPNSPEGNWAPIACLKDDQWQLPGGQRTLQHTPNGPAIPGEEMTVEKCIDGCFGSGYTIAGLENGQECWCDSGHFPLSQVTGDAECNMPCLMNAAEICGGANRLYAYSFNGQL